jgi:hypothetical protein
MRRAVASALISGLCLTLASCSHDQAAGPVDPPDNTTSSSVTTPTTTAPSDPAQDAPPVMPALAKQKSTAGAKAFIRYYMRTADYAFTKPDANPLRRLSTPDCDFCRSLIDVSARLRRDGGKQTGGKLTVLSTTLAGEDNKKLVFLVHLHIGRGYSRGKASGRRHLIHATSFAAEVHVDRTSPGWLISYVEPR